MATGDFYQVLGVPDTATQAEIKKAYRRLAKQHHPDANAGNAQAAERFKQISEAHATLSDPQKRKQYDQMRRLGAFDPRTRRPAGANAGGRGPTAESEDFEFDLGGLGGLGDIFSSIFGRGRGGDDGHGETVETQLEVPFRTAALGGNVQVRIPVTETCPTCHGNGAAPGATLGTCDECHGRGTISFGKGSFAVNRPCPKCRGRGKIPSEFCPTCRGAGEIRTERVVSVAIPPGSDTGTKIRLRGQGDAGRGGAGDLLITLQVQPDRFFTRDGLDVQAEIPINMVQAAQGTSVRVRTLDGKKVLLRIPSGTQPGRKFRIKGQGIERNGKRGDQIVSVKVTIPESLSAEAKEKLKEFADEAGLPH